MNVDGLIVLKHFHFIQIFKQLAYRQHYTNTRLYSQTIYPVVQVN